jgi:hypothetical protein
MTGWSDTKKERVRASYLEKVEALGLSGCMEKVV